MSQDKAARRKAIMKAAAKMKRRTNQHMGAKPYDTGRRVEEERFDATGSYSSGTLLDQSLDEIEGIR